MSTSRRTLSLALALTPGIGGKTICRVLARNDLLGRSPEQFLAVSEITLRVEYRMPTRTAQKWLAERSSRLEEAKSVEERLDRFEVTMVTAADAPYPGLIEEMDPDPPGVLFFYGNKRLLEAKTFAVLSSRKSPPAALDRIERLAENGVLEGETIIAGHDTPEYQRAAVVPLRWGAPRIIVLDRGLFAALGEELKDEPFRTGRLWRYQFDASTDLAISATRPDADYHREANRTRDRLIACLAMRLDIVIAAPGGNMERLAQLAIRAGRRVRISDLSHNYRELCAAGAEALPE